MEDHLQVAIQLMHSQRLPEARQLLKQFTKRQSKNIDGWLDKVHLTPATVLEAFAGIR